MGAINAPGLTRGQNSTDDINVFLPTTGTPVCSVKAQATLGMATKPTADDTVTIGSNVYTFVATPAVAGDVAIGALVANSQENLVTAINDGDTYNDAHPDVVAGDFATNDMIITAKVAGTAANAIVTEETFTAPADAWDAATMGTTTAGVEGTPGEIGQAYIDSLYLYYCVALQSAGANWRRISLGSAY